MSGDDSDALRSLLELLDRYRREAEEKLAQSPAADLVPLYNEAAEEYGRALREARLTGQAMVADGASVESAMENFHRIEQAAHEKLEAISELFDAADEMGRASGADIAERFSENE